MKLWTNPLQESTACFALQFGSMFTKNSVSGYVHVIGLMTPGAKKSYHAGLK